MGSTELRVQFSPAAGALEIQLTLTGLSYTPPKRCKYEAALEQAQLKYAEFKSKFELTGGKYERAIEEACYINWHTIVKPRGYVKYPVMLMTKNRMNQVWSWALLGRPALF